MNIADLNKAHELSNTRTKLVGELHKLKSALPTTFVCQIYYQGYSTQQLREILMGTGLAQEKAAAAMIETLRQELEQRLDAVETDLKELGIVLHEAASPEAEDTGYAIIPSDEYGNKL